jgi:predicted ATPase/class 3 adenylate cyclase
MDRRHALAHRIALPERARGAALFADISGFTPLTEALARELGPRLGAEELTRHLNQVYDALIAELHRYHGSVLCFSGDAITCWLDADDGARATACALAMQGAMQRFATVTTRAGTSVSLGMKAAVATGPVRRFLVGDPRHCIIDAMAGATLDHLAAAEHLAERGDVVLDPAAAAALGERVAIRGWRDDTETGGRFAVVSGLTVHAPAAPWPPLPPDALRREQVCGWLLPPVYHRLCSGHGDFLAELRPAVALFLRFGGIEYDRDPAAADKLDLFIRRVEDILGRYDASLLNLTIGDKGSYVFAAFGAPIAHEDDPARAASAALELQTAATRLDFLTPVQIGITQGRMRTGAYGSRTRRTYSALGDAVNLSARLMAAAGPGQTLVDRRVFAAAGHAFTWQDLPAILVKGKREPVTVAGLIASTERAARRLLEPRYALPMVGRQAELALAGQKLEQARQGKGQIVGITAEAGMGKSRLAAEVIRRALEQGLVGYGGECQSYGTTTSYLVWRSIWRGIYGLDPTAPPAEQVRDLEARLRAIDPRLLPRLPLLGAVLSLSIPDNDLTRSLEAKVRKSSLEALLVDCLRAKAGDHPLLLVLEDCHWLDPLSGDLIEAIGRGTADLPVLLLLVYRPPEAHDVSWARLCKLPHFTEIVLAEFTPQEAERLIQLKLEQFFGCEADVPPAFVARIAERAQGNPFYIEELLNYLQDRGIHPRDEEALAQVDLPASLYSLILTRMDQLTETQQTTLKVASVIGRLFQPAMLWGVYPQLGSLDRVRADLQALYGLDLTLLDTPEPELTYLFKHIISQEVAYESLLYATRAMLHEQIGAFIERTYPDTLEQYLNLLAFHYEHSENEPKKRAYLLRAGEAAQADYGNEAAIEYYRKVLPLLPAEERIGTQLKLGQVLELTGQWQEAEERYADALALTRQLGDRLSQAWCETAIAELFRKRGQYEQASAWLERARVGFEELGDAKGRGQVLHYGGTLAAQQGQYETARALYEDSLAIRRSLGDRSSMASLLSNLGIVARFEGNYPLARSLHEEALAIRRDLGDRWAIGVSLNNLGNVALDQGNYAEARSLHEEGLSIRRQVGDRWAIANALNNLANLTCAQGDFAAAQDLYHESLSINRELGDKWALAYLLEDIGSLAAAKDQPGQALTLTAAAATIREEIGAPLSPAEQGKLDRALEPACQVLSEMEQAAARAAGRAMSLEQAIEDALQGLGKPPD